MNIRVLLGISTCVNTQMAQQQLGACDQVSSPDTAALPSMHAPEQWQQRAATPSMRTLRGRGLLPSPPPIPQCTPLKAGAASDKPLPRVVHSPLKEWYYYWQRSTNAPLVLSS